MDNNKFSSKINAQPECTKSRIFASAKNLIENSRIEHVTIRKIAEVSGVSGPLILQYFGSKDKLILEIFKKTNADIANKISDIENEPAHHSPLSILLKISQILLERAQLTSSLTGKVLAYSYEWSSEGEDSFRCWLAPILAAISDLLRKNRPGLSEDDAMVCAQVYIATYTQISRVSYIYNWPVQEALENIKPHLQMLARGIPNDTALAST